MKKANATTTRKSSKRPTVRGGTRKPVDLEEIRRKITNLVGAEAGPMVESAIEEAHKGHFGAMKYLFGIVGLYPAGEAETGQSENSLARTLLHRLGLPEEPELQGSMPQNQVTKESERDSTGKEGDAVE